MYAGVGGGGRHTDSNNPMHAYLLINGLCAGMDGERSVGFVYVSILRNQRFVRGYGWRTFRWICLRIDSPVTEKSLEKDVRKQAVEE